MFKLTKKQKEAINLFKQKAYYILLYGGSRSGKTSLAMYICLHTALSFPRSQILVCKYFLSDLRKSIIYQTLPQLCRFISPEFESYVNKAINNKDHYLKFPNGSVIWFEGLSNEQQSEKILGREYNLIFLSEATQVTYPVYDKLLSRLAENVSNFTNRIILDCNPTTINSWVYKLFIENKDPINNFKKDKKRYSMLLMNPTDNPNLSDQYIEILESCSDKQTRRFLKGEWVEDLEGVLWKESWIAEGRVEDWDIDNSNKIVIGVDPAISTNSKSNQTGIVVAGKIDNKYYVLEDATGKYTPYKWALKISDLYYKYSANKVVVESNQGGDLVKSNINNIDSSISVKKVHAKRGKFLRAEPIAALYEGRKVFHVGHFKELEYQMLSWNPAKNSESPDRIDALVYALMELKEQFKTPRVF